MGSIITPKPGRESIQHQVQNAEDQQAKQHTPAKRKLAPSSNVGSMRTAISPPPLKRQKTGVAKEKPVSKPHSVNWTIPKMVDRLWSYREDVNKTHGRMAIHAIESAKITDRRVHTGKDLFAGLSMEPVPMQERSTLRIKIKHTGINTTRDTNENFKAICIKSIKAPGPRYDHLTIGLENNVVAAQTPMQFYPHKGDLDSDEKQKKRNEYLKELEEMHDHKLSPIELNQKRDFIIHNDRIVLVLTYFDTWLKSLKTPGLKDWLLSNIEAPANNSSVVKATSEATRTGSIFVEAWKQVFRGGKTAHGVKLTDIRLSEVLSRYSRMHQQNIVGKPPLEPRPRKTASLSHKDGFRELESEVKTYVSLGCLICFKHSCEHGFYTDANSRERFSLDKGWLARRLAAGENPKQAKPGAIEPCTRKCYRVGSITDHEGKPWSSPEHKALRAISMSTSACLEKLDPICHAAALLDRDCREVNRKFGELGITLPRKTSPRKEEPDIPRLFWLSHDKKKLTKRHGVDKHHKPNWDHVNRRINNINDLRGCDHDGPCEPSNKKCPCAPKGYLCEKYCGCSDGCVYRFVGCDCKSQGKTCASNWGECICRQLNRECDPDLCGSCGVVKLADPQNATETLSKSAGCKNWSLQRGIPKKLVIGESQFGYGLFAAENIKKAEFIIEYVGEIVSGEEGDRRYVRRQNLFERQKSSSYNFTLLKVANVWVDAARYGNLSRYINHISESSPKCNVQPKLLLINGGFRLELRAKRNIQAWEELLFDYGQDFEFDSDSDLPSPANVQSPRKVARKTAPAAGEHSDTGQEEDTSENETGDPSPEYQPPRGWWYLKRKREAAAADPAMQLDNCHSVGEEVSEPSTPRSKRHRSSSSGVKAESGRSRSKSGRSYKLPAQSTSTRAFPIKAEEPPTSRGSSAIPPTKGATKNKRSNRGIIVISDSEGE